MLLSRSVKHSLMQEGRIEDHHSFINTGWISFYMHNTDDKEYAIKLLRIGYERLIVKSGLMNPDLLPISK
jgi:hypothetical protein